jgi:hypothetical protein
MTGIEDHMDRRQANHELAALTWPGGATER